MKAVFDTVPVVRVTSQRAAPGRLSVQLAAGSHQRRTRRHGMFWPPTIALRVRMSWISDLKPPMSVLVIGIPTKIDMLTLDQNRSDFPSAHCWSIWQYFISNKIW